MHFKLIVVFVENEKTKAVMDAAREAGATGATVIHQARGEGLEEKASFFGLQLETLRDVILFVVEEHRCRRILETVGRVGQFDEKSGTGMALQLDIEDAVGVMHQIEEISESLEEAL